MTLDFAPMEGITGRDLREVHAACFPGVDRYWLPFLTPAANHCFTPRQRRDLEPGPLGYARLVPQVLTRDPADFLWAAGELGELGYAEVNLNLGCPSGTVVGKGKGSGMLRSPEELDRFLETVFSAAPIPVSVKTRIGLEDPAEWERLLPVFARYPIRELCVHPRTRRERYKGRVHFEAFAEAAARLPYPLRYNGNLFTPAAVQRVEAACPGLSGVMIGRGLLADPALIARCRGGHRDREALIAFHWPPCTRTGPCCPSSRSCGCICPCCCPRSGPGSACASAPAGRSSTPWPWACCGTPPCFRRRSCPG